MHITSAHAEHLIEVAQSTATSLGIAVSVAVLDASGHLKAFSRMDRAWLGSIDVAIKKAKTSILFETDSEKVWEFSKPEAQAHGLDLTNGVLVTFAGGIPLRTTAGALLGAIGVSGGQVSQDREVAHAGALALREQLTSGSNDSTQERASC
jgi:uncharacterized protein GlcG (DUF336 family)